MLRNLVAVVVLALASPASLAKCEKGWIEFSGRVTNATGKPLAGVAVGIAWSRDEQPRGPALAVTDAAGRYAIPVEYDTYSGMSITLGDRCDATLGEVSVSAYSATRRSRELRLVASDAQRQRLPTLVIDRPIARTPLWPKGQ